jgi:hypothetical protein
VLAFDATCAIRPVGAARAAGRTMQRASTSMALAVRAMHASGSGRILRQ